jgi:hypothetical protein
MKRNKIRPARDLQPAFASAVHSITIEANGMPRAHFFVDPFVNTFPVLEGNTMNSHRETRGDPLQAPTPPESLLPAHASPASINELTERVKKLEGEVEGLKRKVELLRERTA